MSKPAKSKPTESEDLALGASPSPAGDSEETPAPDTIPAPAPHPETISADHGFPSPRRCQPQE